mmetsp:Transcript_2774/g.6502  ORF Transcript_2774/g.6502 Transcript_2774/m.6502 type:complete len:86 (+) Transcript_2774:332-589(+)
MCNDDSASSGCSCAGKGLAYMVYECAESMKTTGNVKDNKVAMFKTMAKTTFGQELGHGGALAKQRLDSWQELELVGGLAQECKRE